MIFSMRLIVASLLAGLLSTPVFAAHEVTFQIVDDLGNPVPGTALVVRSAGPERGAAARVAVNQREERFQPEFLVVQTGTEIVFPNRDTEMHHVYSFSHAKRFELPLHLDQVPNPVLMDEPGMVVVACSIHDQMIGHILVVDSPHFAITDEAGLATVQMPEEPRGFVVWYRTASGRPNGSPSGRPDGSPNGSQSGFHALERQFDPASDLVVVRVEQSSRISQNTRGQSTRWSED